MYAEFTDNLVTGNEMIDSQHKELIEKINAVMESCEQSNDKSVAVKTLDYLEDYTNYHFSAEEQLQREIDTLASRSIKSSMRSLSRPSLTCRICCRRRKDLHRLSLQRCRRKSSSGSMSTSRDSTVLWLSTSSCARTTSACKEDQGSYALEIQ